MKPMLVLSLLTWPVFSFVNKHCPELYFALLMKERSDRFGAKTKFRLNRAVVGVVGFQGCLYYLEN